MAMAMPQKNLQTLDTRHKQPDLEDDSDAPIVTVDVVSSELYSSGGGGETVCDAADEELERVKNSCVAAASLVIIS